MNRLDKLQKGIDCFLAIFLLVTIFSHSATKPFPKAGSLCTIRPDIFPG